MLLKKILSKKNIRAFAAVLALSAMTIACSISAFAETVEYDNLKELLIAGSADLQAATDSYYSNVEKLNSMINTINEERQQYVLQAELLKDDDRTAASEYTSEANQMGKTLKTLRKQLSNQTNIKQQLSVEKTVNTYLIMAQSTMVSYNQAVLNADAKAKSYQAALTTYQNTLTRASAGMATENDVTTAYNNMLLQQNEMKQYKQNAADLRESLLAMLGITDSADVTIGTVPDLDLSLIDAIDFEADKAKAIVADSDVKNARNNVVVANSAGYELRFDNIADEESSAEVDITDAYNQLLAERVSFEGAQASYQAAKLTYDGALRKKQAGMLTEAGWQSAEATYLQAYAQYKTAAMSIFQTYSNYKWQVIGLSSGGSAGGSAGMGSR